MIILTFKDYINISFNVYEITYFKLKYCLLSYGDKIVLCSVTSDKIVVLVIFHPTMRDE
jgi:hypothetical protein